MKLESHSFDAGGPIPAEFALGRIDPESHVAFAPNRNPHLAWSDVPPGTLSFAVLCIDTDVPTVPDDVNQEGRTVPASLPRAEFVHWAMVDVPATTHEIAAGSCSDGVTPGGKHAPPGPRGARQGRNDYTGWFAEDPKMGGTWLGYDGPGPPWNDELVHHYHFRVLALDLEHLPVGDGFQAADVLRAARGHVLDQAELVGTYSLNPARAPR